MDHPLLSIHLGAVLSNDAALACTALGAPL